jgi:hypothetical protein
LLKFQSEAGLGLWLSKSWLSAFNREQNAATIFGRLPPNLMRDVEQSDDGKRADDLSEIRQVVEIHALCARRSVKLLFVPRNQTGLNINGVVMLSEAKHL